MFETSTSDIWWPLPIKHELHQRKEPWFYHPQGHMEFRHQLHNEKGQ